MRSAWAKRSRLSLAAQGSHVSRMETGDMGPKPGAALNVPAALGKALAIVPIEEALKEEAMEAEGHLGQMQG